MYGRSFQELLKIGVEPVKELPGFSLIVPDGKAAFYWPDDNRWGEQHFPKASK